MKLILKVAVAAVIAASCAGIASQAAAQATATDAARGVAKSYTVKPQYKRRVVTLVTDEAPGTIIVDTNNKYLYYVEGDDHATRYGIGVGRDGFGWSGVVKVGRKAEWPGWTPPPEMRVREAKAGHKLPAFQEGGEGNPLGARALYLYQNGHDSGFRIHGTNQPWSIGLNLSSGCIRMMNSDVENLYERSHIGTKVIVVGPGDKQGEVSYDDRGIDLLRTLFGG
jgi:lipoprotein-anchoring transpeptidase ErfK/SrfK